MAGRIINMLLPNFPLMRQDRSLVVWFGNWPDERIDDDIVFTGWAWDPWPVRSGHIGDGTDQGNWPLSNRCVYVEDILWSGCANFVYRITGQVLDSLGQPVSGVRCRLYGSSDEQYMAETLSGPTGEYSFGVFDTTTQYYVLAMRGAPPVAGATVRTLVGAL